MPRLRPKRSTPRAVTVARRRTLLRAVEVSALDAWSDPRPLRLHEVEERPRTRGDCADGPRPCPWAGCRYHLPLDVHESGGIKLNFPDLQLHELAETCALDVADQGGATLERVGELLNVTRERTRQIEVRAAQRARSLIQDLDIGPGIDADTQSWPLEEES